MRRKYDRNGAIVPLFSLNLTAGLLEEETPHRENFIKIRRYMEKQTVRPYVVGIGELLWDMLPEGKKPGGATANFAYHISQFGLKGVVVSAVGNDPLGDELEALLASRGVSTSLQRNDYPTGRVSVSLDDQGIPTYSICEHTAWDHIRFDETLAQIASECAAASFGSLAQREAVSRESIHRFLQGMPAKSWRIFDINLRRSFYTEEVIKGSLGCCNILKINDEELVVLDRMLDLGGGSLEELCRRVMDRYSLRAVILTCGSRGSYVFTTEASSFRETPRVDVVDTVGAGDSFTGSFCAALLRGKSIPEAHALAVDVAAYVCTQAGGMPPMPKELTSRLG